MAELDRKALICQQATIRVTGIDFVRVFDPEDQHRLQVFFLVDPDTLDVDPFDLLVLPPPGFVNIEAIEDDSTVDIAAATHRDADPTRTDHRDVSHTHDRTDESVIDGVIRIGFGPKNQ